MTHGPYRVSHSGALREQLERLLDLARIRGVHHRVAHALIEIEGHLELHPESWGDPTHELPALQLKMYRRVYDKLSIQYGVHTLQPVVFLIGITPKLDHPLAG